MKFIQIAPRKKIDIYVYELRRVIEKVENENDEKSNVDFQGTHHNDGGVNFLQFIKLVMSKIVAKDWNHFDDQFTSIRVERLRESLDQAIITGTYEKGTKSHVDREDMENLQDLKTNAPIVVTYDDVHNEKENIIRISGKKLLIARKTSFDKLQKMIQEEIKEENIGNLQERFICALKRIDDEGLNLRNCVHQLWCEFDSSVLKRSYNTYKLASRVFQLFVQCVFDRRKARVKEWIDVNTRALKSTEKVEGLLRSMEQQFEHVQRTCVNPCDMSCKECHFNCLEVRFLHQRQCASGAYIQ
ncbi:hypothetical protein RFI_34076 [Reticulomyxa filosa]|uniref:Uncharacterized protein n=1 Tax=Reticulomyxa filosa TaxID=46433 RepID=X6LRH1_RETFI|nr:hypothetical protein RFI_34076 [Reticulomyxa filosa]|eukprot:ETO03335.1 hypothetical protein RFI_34076 [Reticulomyxa filosa]